jgi:hypothetical protein
MKLIPLMTFKDDGVLGETYLITEGKDQGYLSLGGFTN